MLKIDNEFIEKLQKLIETSEISKKHNTPLANRILKLTEEVGELSQAYLKYSWSVNASNSAWDTKTHLLEEAQDVLLVIIDILNQIVENEEEQKIILDFLEKKNNKWKSKLI